MIQDGILEDLATGNFKLTKHAKIRMLERNITMADLFRVGKTGICSKMPDQKFKVKGTDNSDDEVVLICAYDNGTLIITVF